MELINIIILIGIGLLVGQISNKLKLPTSIILILLGVIFSNIFFNNYSFSPYFILLNLSILAILLILFNSINEFSFHELDTYGEIGLKIFLVSFVLNILFFSFVLNVFLKFSIIFSILLAILLTSTDYNVYNHLIKPNRFFEFLKYESFIGTIIMIFLVFLFLTFIKFEKDILNLIFIPIISETFVGFGIGLIVAIVSFKFLEKMHYFSELFLFVSLLLSFFLASFLNANGIFSIIVFSLLFERMTFKKKTEIKKFTKFFSLMLVNFIFIIYGMILPKINLEIILEVFVSFIIYLLLRFVSLFLALLNHNVNFKELFFMTLVCPKGIDVVAIALVLLFLFPSLYNFVAIFILFSLITSSFAVYFLKNSLRQVEED